MATYHSTTTCDSAKVTDTEAVESLINQYEWHVSTVRVENGYIEIHGEGTPDPYRNYHASGLSYEDIKTEHGVRELPEMDAFCWRLSQFLADGEEFVVETIGNEKARYVSAVMYRVTPTGVYFSSLHDNEQLVLPEKHAITSVEFHSKNDVTVHDQGTIE